MQASFTCRIQPVSNPLQCKTLPDCLLDHSDLQLPRHKHRHLTHIPSKRVTLEHNECFVTMTTRPLGPLGPPIAEQYVKQAPELVV